MPFINIKVLKGTSFILSNCRGNTAPGVAFLTLLCVASMGIFAYKAGKTGGFRSYWEDLNLWQSALYLLPFAIFLSATLLRAVFDCFLRLFFWIRNQIIKQKK